mgnify:CR=1 FL=1
MSPQDSKRKIGWDKMDHLSAYPRIHSKTILKQMLIDKKLCGIRQRQFEDAFNAFDKPKVLYRYDHTDIEGLFASGSVWMRSMPYMALNYLGEAKSDLNEGQSVLESGDNFRVPDGDFTFGGIKQTRSTKGTTFRNMSTHTAPNPNTFCICLSTRCSPNLASYFHGPNSSVSVISMPIRKVFYSIREAIIGQNLPLKSFQSGHVFYSPSKKQILKNSSGVCGNLVKKTKYSLESEYRFTATFSEKICYDHTLKLNVKWPSKLPTIKYNAIQKFSRPYWFYKQLDKERISCIPMNE